GRAVGQKQPDLGPLAEALLLQPGGDAVDELVDLAICGDLPQEARARSRAVGGSRLVEQAVDGAGGQLLVPGHARGVARSPRVRGGRSRIAGFVRSTRGHAFPLLFEPETVCPPFQTPRLCTVRHLAAEIPGRRDSGVPLNIISPHRASPASLCRW